MLHASLRNIIAPKICGNFIQNKELVSDIETYPKTHWVFNMEGNCCISIPRNRNLCFLAGFVKWDETEVMDDIISLSIGDKSSK